MSTSTEFHDLRKDALPLDAVEFEDTPPAPVPTPAPTAPTTDKKEPEPQPDPQPDPLPTPLQNAMNALINTLNTAPRLPPTQSAFSASPKMGSYLPDSATAGASHCHAQSQAVDSQKEALNKHTEDLEIPTLRPQQYFKITNELENHNGHQYPTGLNTLRETETFAADPRESCAPGGLYFTTLEFLHHFYTYGIFIREVILPREDEKFKMVMDPACDKWRANMIILGKKYPLYSLNTLKHFNLVVDDLYVDRACRYGDVALLEHLFTHYSMVKINFSTAIVHNLEQKRIDVTKCLYAHAQKMNMSMHAVHQDIIKSDNFELMEFILGRTYDKGPLLETIIGCGSVAMLEDLYKNHPALFSGEKSSSLCTIAAKRGVVKILQLLIEWGYPLTEDTMRCAFARFDLDGKTPDILKCLFQHNCPAHCDAMYRDGLPVDVQVLIEANYPNVKLCDTPEYFEDTQRFFSLKWLLGTGLAVAGVIALLGEVKKR